MFYSFCLLTASFYEIQKELGASLFCCFFFVSRKQFNELNIILTGKKTQIGQKGLLFALKLNKYKII